MAIAISSLLAVRPAAAVDIACIESSRYVYLYRLFGGDQRRFAAYFNLNPAILPPPQACRAALVSGEIQPDWADTDKLVQMIAQNAGWLDTLYLDSPGGNVYSGIRLALVTREFWLKARVAPPGTSFTFDPDFGPSATAQPPDAGRVAFNQAVAALATRTDRHRGDPFCASACTYTLAAGVDRHGVAKVHRPRNNAESLQASSARAALAEVAMMRVYKKMDVGDAFMALTRDTGSITTSQFVVSRYPRFLEDLLLDRCKSDGAQLDDLAALVQLSLAGPDHFVPLQRNELQGALQKIETRRQDVRQCVGALGEKERLEAFRRLCPSGCNTTALRANIADALKVITK